MHPQGLLRLPGEDGVEVFLARDVLASIDRAHCGVVVLDRLLTASAEWDDYAPPWRRQPLLPQIWYPLDWGDQYLLDQLQFEGERVVLASARFESPGFWEFLGGLNPLEVVRVYLNDRHRRRQDRHYREDAEKRQLGLENDLREIEVLRQRIDLARANGVGEDVIVRLVNQLVGEPLRKLGALQDQGLSMAARPSCESFRRAILSKSE